MAVHDGIGPGRIKASPTSGSDEGSSVGEGRGSDPVRPEGQQGFGVLGAERLPGNGGEGPRVRPTGQSRAQQVVEVVPAGSGEIDPALESPSVRRMIALDRASPLRMRATAVPTASPIAVALPSMIPIVIFATI